MTAEKSLSIEVKKEDHKEYAFVAFKNGFVVNIKPDGINYFRVDFKNNKFETSLDGLTWVEFPLE